ncbi:hypothetical protein Pan153_56770 [Gimesia panareensis]|uniref:DUF4440 domain-containing protein n=1 Tax=Gimesia panareensis TaxID=2527978 RepID=A0A518FX87_9PLAN|nr:hypothetical protein [Gimesia panareensis]QDV20995.1 hypothetical protein Pan153_56770 [Gimesia panareensis]
MWFTETAIPPIAICSVIAVILFIQWYLRRQSKYLVGMAIALVMMVASYFIELSIITPRERVEADLYGLVDAFQNKEADATLDYISPRAAALRGKVNMALTLVTIDGELRITDVETELLADDSIAKTHFRANGAATFRGISGRSPTRWLLTWQKMGGEWKVTEAQRLNPITGEQISDMAAQ